MIMNIIKPPMSDINKAEVMRYMGVRNTDESINALIESCVDECRDVFDFKLCYEEFDIFIKDGTVDFGFTSVKSKSLAKNLDGCKKAIISVATVGLAIDRLIHRYVRIAPSKSVCLQAIGTERIEALCDSFEMILTQKYEVHPRFSPGYGDLSLSMQKDIFAFFDCPKLQGVTLNESLLMSPSKSVTAITGIKEKI